MAALVDACDWLRDVRFAVADGHEVLADGHEEPGDVRRAAGALVPLRAKARSIRCQGVFVKEFLPVE